MKGTREPLFEIDFPPGSDMVGEILHGPRAAERMEFKLFTRFATYESRFSLNATACFFVRRQFRTSAALGSTSVYPPI